MTQTAKEAEAQQASVVFSLALVQIGVSTIDDALKLWGEVSTTPAQVAPTSGRWLARAVNLVLTRRGKSRELAMSYYRLIRALRTGSTVADWRHPEPEYVTLGDLRREFRLLVEEQGVPQAKSPQAATVLQAVLPDGELPPEPEEHPEDDDERIFIEELKRLEEEERKADEAAEQEARDTLDQLGAEVLRKRLELIDGGLTADEADAAREEAHRKAGARQASGAERVVLDGARGQLWIAGGQDRKVKGWVRVSRTGTPCGWCAMLISRGAVYRSKASAEYDDGDLYHTNCHCYAEQIFSAEQFENDPRFDLNRKYAEEWPRITKGLSGKTALAAWRKHIRLEQRSAPIAAQEVA